MSKSFGKPTNILPQSRIIIHAKYGWLKCDPGKTHQKRTILVENGKHIETRLVDCPIGIIAKYFKNLNVWKISHTFNEHSHEPIVNPTCLTIAWHLKSKENQEL